MTARDLQAKIGKLCYLQANGLEVLCQIRDAKASYGRLRVQIEPQAGKGRAWVSISSVRDWTAQDALLEGGSTNVSTRS